MNYCALICEYNPLHNGHLYQLNEIRKATDCEKIICVMSGDFVQRAEPAIMNKQIRAKCALNCGADMVIELPIPCAIGNGTVFARGAVEAINALPHVKYLAMGCETMEINTVLKLAEIQSEESIEFKETLSCLLKSGHSYPHSYAEATAQIAEIQGIDGAMSRIILSKPNNILCLEYIKALKRLKSQIRPILLPRRANGIYPHEKNIEITSSSEIRARLAQKRNSDVFNAVPAITSELLSENQNYLPNPETFSDIAIHTLRSMTVQELSLLPEISEGIEYAIVKTAGRTSKLIDFLTELKSKRYTLSRLKRICLQAVLEINSNVMSGITLLYFRILAIKSNFKSYLGELPDNFYIKIDNENSSMSLKTLHTIEKRATLLYALLTHNDSYSYPTELITD